MQQIQSPAADQCMRQAQQDIALGRPTTHVVYCSSTGKMLCCEVDGSGQIVDNSCGVIQQIATPLNNLSIVDGMTVMSSEEPPKQSVGTPSR